MIARLIAVSLLALINAGIIEAQGLGLQSAFERQYQWPAPFELTPKDARPFSIAFIGDQSGISDADLNAQLDWVAANIGVDGRLVRGFHIGGAFNGSGVNTTVAARVTFFNTLKKIRSPLKWSLIPSHSSGDQNDAAGILCTGNETTSPDYGENVCSTVGDRLDLGGLGIGFQYSGPNLLELPSIEVVASGHDTTDLDVFWHAIRYRWLDTGIIVFAGPWSMDNEGAWDAGIAAIQAKWGTDEPIVAFGHGLMGDNGQGASVSPFDRSVTPCIAQPGETNYIWEEDQVVLIMGSHCPNLNPGCTTRTQTVGETHKVMGCTIDSVFVGNNNGDWGELQVATFDCPNDTITVRTVDMIDNTSGESPGCTWPASDAEVDLLGADCCAYTAPFGAADGDCARVDTETSMNLQARGMCS